MRIVRRRAKWRRSFSMDKHFTRLLVSLILFAGFLSNRTPLWSAELPHVTGVESQPLLMQVTRLREAMNFLGQPFSKETIALLEKAKSAEKDADVSRLVQQAIDPYCLFGVTINPESRVKVSQGRPNLC